MAIPQTITNLIGVIADYIYIGLTGPKLENNGGVLEVKNNAGNAAARVKFATGVDDLDGVNYKQFIVKSRLVIISAQADCSSALPTNTATRGMYTIVTTAGNGAVVGDYLYDDGLSTGDMTIVSPFENQCTAITDNLIGGTLTFKGDCIYTWDTDTSVHRKISDPDLLVSGAERVIRFSAGTSTISSTALVPANAIITYAAIKTGTAYSGGGTLQLGSTSTANRLIDTAEVNPQRASTLFFYVLDNAWEASNEAIKLTVGGAPAAGSCTVTVKYCAPDA